MAIEQLLVTKVISGIQRKDIILRCVIMYGTGLSLHAAHPNNVGMILSRKIVILPLIFQKETRSSTGNRQKTVCEKP